MKLMVVSSWFPYPPYNGSRIRVYNLLKRLAQRHDVYLYTFAQEDQDHQYKDELLEFCRQVHIIDEKPFTPSLHTAAAGILSIKPRSSVECHSEEMASAVKSALVQEQFDAAVAFTLRAAEYIADARYLPKVLDEENAEAAYIKRQIQGQSDRLSKFRHKMTWVKARMHERNLALKFDSVTVVSDEDRLEVEQVVPELASRQAVRVVRNAVDLELLNYQAGMRDCSRIVYTGALSYFANADAVRYFCSHILPDVRKRLPDARFMVTGSTSGVDLEEFKDLVGVEFTGFVPDIRPVVAEASVLVVPARLGGGTRLKVLEAMALGTPVVATSFGAMGINAQNGKHLLLADDPRKFADAVVTVMQDDSLAEKIRGNARKLVRSKFGWDTAADRLNDAILYAVKTKGEGACTQAIAR